MIKYSLLYIGLFLFVTANCQPPAKYYDSATGKSCDKLKSALMLIISTGDVPKSYNALWNQYLITDIKPRTIGTGSTNVIDDIYSSKPGGTDPYQFTPNTQQCGTYNGEGDCYNREHSVPQSWFNGNTSNNGEATDYLHIYPTDGTVNGLRSNYPYGEVTSASTTTQNGSKFGNSAVAGITGKVFEPIDSFKGDVARSFLYFVTRYESNMVSFATNADAVQAFDGNTFPSVKIPFLKLMIKWHNLDPVSQKEIIRNNGAYSFQKNRNPYIDHPEYVDLVWNKVCNGLSALPVDILYFTGKLNNGSVQLVWKATNEVGVKEYVIERSFNKEDYQAIYSINANAKERYSYADFKDFAKGANYLYRLKIINDNGSYQYSDIVSVNIPLNEEISIYPNPSHNYIKCQISGTQPIVAMQLMDVMGKSLMNKTFTVNNGVITIPVAGISSGVYFIKLTIGDKQITRQVNIIQ